MDQPKMTEELESRVRDRAFQLWEEEGCPDGKEKEHWERALAEIQREQARQETALSPPATTFAS